MMGGFGTNFGTNFAGALQALSVTKKVVAELCVVNK